MLERFIDWAVNVAKLHNANDVQISLTKGELSANRTARLDIDTPSAVARITCWESGDYDAEIIDLNSEAQIYMNSGTLKIDVIFSQQFQIFFQKLGIVLEAVVSSPAK